MSVIESGAKERPLIETDTLPDEACPQAREAHAMHNDSAIVMLLFFMA
jgi:hypothetical protein